MLAVDKTITVQQVDSARDWLLCLLDERYWIKDRVSVRLKDMRHASRYRNWLACYRSTSQFKSGVIFWVALDFIQKVDKCGRDTIIGVQLDPLQVLRETLAHEYGHVVAEYARYRLPAVHNRMMLTYIGGEEDFAEDIALLLNDREPVWSNRDFLEQVVCDYRNSAFND